MNKPITWAPKVTKELPTASIRIRYPSGTNHVFHILGERGSLEIVTIKSHLPYSQLLLQVT